MKMQDYFNSLGFLVITFLVLCITYIVQIITRKFYEISKLLKIAPLCEGIPYSKILGHTTLFVNLENLLTIIRTCSKTESPPRILRLGLSVYFMITRPKDLEIVLNNQHCLYKHKLLDMTIPHQGSGLFNLSGPIWKKHRKVIATSFKRKFLENFVPTFYEKAEICVDVLNKTNEEIIDIYEYINKYSLDSICETAMGYNLDSLTKDSKLATAIEKGMEISMLRICNVFYQNDILFKLSKHSKVFYESTKYYHDCMLMMIKKKKNDYFNNVKGADKNCNEIQRKAFLDILIELTENEEEWSNEELLGEVGNFITAGSDTLASAVSFTILMLAMHPEIEKKCFEEVRSVVGLNNTVTHDDFPKLEYLEKVIKESMRLFPPAPVTIRRTNADVEIGGYTIPKDAGLMLPIIRFHTSNEYYKDPYKFDPERFSAEEANRPKYTYLPFSNGPRNCIGMLYAMMSMKTILSVLIRNFRFETSFKDIKEIRLQQCIVLKSVEGFPVKVISRY